MVIALGVMLSGEKQILGFVQTETENERVVAQFVRSLSGSGPGYELRFVGGDRWEQGAAGCDSEGVAPPCRGAALPVAQA